ncbi:MAG TPA: hypothetical protein VH107_09905 [Lacipirellulaceae bacterium]|nr:hypothetical protein [Lacipirellulaceae bacterium]
MAKALRRASVVVLSLYQKIGYGVDVGGSGRAVDPLLESGFCLLV